jgi:hypothetical protein
MKTLEQIMADIPLHQENHSRQQMQSTGHSTNLTMSPTPSTPYIDTSKQNRRDLGQFVSQCFDALNTYGKTPDQLANATKMFVNILKDYPMDAVIKAFGSWMRRSSIMPTPADIVNIIDPPAPKPDWAAYVSIRQRMKDPYTFVMDDEKAYVRYCERYSVDKLNSYDQRQEAQEQLAEAQSRLLPSGDDYDHSI